MLKSIQSKIVILFMLVILAIFIVAGTLIVSNVTQFYYNDFMSQMENSVFDHEFEVSLSDAIESENVEEKLTELEDDGVQCPGKRVYEYAINFNKGDVNALPNKAAEIFAPVKCAVCGRGKGDLPLCASTLEIDNKNIHTTAIKRSSDGEGIVVRYYNPAEVEQEVTIKTEGKLYLCGLDERVKEEIGNTYVAPAKKIVTIKIVK